MDPLELHLTPEIYPQLARDLLSAHCDLPTHDMLACFAHGAVWLETTGKPERLYAPETRLRPGHQLHCYCNDSTLTPCPYRPQLIEDFGDFSIWDKPAGMLSQGSKWGDHWTLQQWIRQHLWPERDCLITHRLDRYTRGLMIVAHSEEINRRFHRLFEQRAIEKTYRAIVHGSMTKGDSQLIAEPIDGRSAETRLSVIDLDRQNNRSLLELQPATGRKHQIRRHLAAIGHSVINDRLYGRPPFNGDLMLQACALAFRNPLTRQTVEVRLDTETLINV